MKKHGDFFYNNLEDELEDRDEDGDEDDDEEHEEDGEEYGEEDGEEYGEEYGGEDGEEDGEENGEEDGEEDGEDGLYDIKITKLKLELQEKSENLEKSEKPEKIEQDNNICIEFKNDKDLEKIQEQYINKINNLNKNVTVTFIVPEILIRTRVFTFYKCWRNGYCLNASTKNIPKNITKIIFKKK